MKGCRIAYLIFFVIGIDVLFLSCNNHNDSVLKVIPIAEYIGEEQCDYFDISANAEISCIPIKSSDYPLGDNMKCAGVYKNLLFLYNDDCVVSIDMKSGSVMNRFERKGNGPEEYITILSASIDSEAKEVVVYDPAKNKIIKYDFDGVYRGDLNIKEKGPVSVTPDGNYLVCYKPHSSKKNLYGIYNRKGELVSETSRLRLEVDSRILGFTVPQSIDGGCLIRQSYQDTILCIGSNGEIPMFYLKLGKYKMPDDYRKNLSLMEKNIDRYIEVNDLNVLKNYLFIGYFYNNKLYRDVWDIEKEELLSRSIIKDNNSRFGFPVQIGDSTIYSWCDFTQQGSLYCFLPYAEALKIFPNIAVEDNSVIMKIKM